MHSSKVMTANTTIIEKIIHEMHETYAFEFTDKEDKRVANSTFCEEIKKIINKHLLTCRKTSQSQDTSSNDDVREGVIAENIYLREDNICLCTQIRLDKKSHAATLAQRDIEHQKDLKRLIGNNELLQMQYNDLLENRFPSRIPIYLMIVLLVVGIVTFIFYSTP